VVPEGRKYDLYSQDFYADAYATFAQMREHDPVVCQPGASTARRRSGG
jgi:hypothetical protein